MNMHCMEYAEQHEYAYVCMVRVNRIEVFILSLVVVVYGCYITQCEWIYCSYGLSVCYKILVSIHPIILYLTSDIISMFITEFSEENCIQK